MIWPGAGCAISRQDTDGEAQASAIQPSDTRETRACAIERNACSSILGQSPF
jgi:hypothetical protein